MPEKPKPESNEEKKSKMPDGTWENDQRERGYYYDDSHGYEPFDPEKEDDDEPEVEADQ